MTGYNIEALDLRLKEKYFNINLFTVFNLPGSLVQ